MKNVVAISVEKIQKYIYKYIDQNQKDDKTLKNIISASNNISKNILKKIQEEFNVREESKFLWISGKVIFSCDLPEERIREKLSTLYRETFMNYHGNIFLNYSVFPENDLTNMAIIKKSNIEFKSNSNKTKIIEENKELLFNFQEFKTNTEVLEEDYTDNFQVFLKSMDDLIDIEDKDSTDGKIAIVKADINELGNTMQELDSYDKFKEISKILENYISVEYFAKCVSEYNKDIERKMLPFYIAGDDIFYAVNIDYLFDSIRILKKVIVQINSEIQKVFNKKENNTTDNEKKGVSIAVGVTFVNNHQPIRYYRQIVEKELSNAKDMMRLDEEKLSLVGLSISGCKLNCYKDERAKKKSDGFNRFCAEIKELNSMIRENVFTSTSLHNLLVNLENEKNPRKQLLYILYFCIPNLSEEAEFDENAYFKNYILSQVVEDSRGKKEKFFDVNKVENILIPKLKVIILFLKENNNKITIKGKDDGNKKKREKKYITSDKKAHSILLNKPINFLLREIKSNGIEKLFIKKIKNSQNKTLYKTANFEPSIFFRAKKLIDDGKKDQVVALFRNYTKNVIGISNENDEINPHRIVFDEKDMENFERKFLELEDTNWLDRLIILFEYNRQRIIYKTYKKRLKYK
ncbi:Cas10/Cmr2 second palm domain-containing protein [Peptostreptococcus canis]|uniref:Cas10/Cmr2 second palm domain-containing protein n=1 Tax=Peptostreptococcus canis TaxID=1159213 RepID=A0ABR6TMA2_9FIRM|nr:hypothetical protein [Peptostreptococcus canis]MBC2576273.1 hypothetical protein [Peptostreptococcus canis]MBP1998190.1 hypothetical protein [Peptostreptococcus canis]